MLRRRPAAERHWVGLAQSLAPSDETSWNSACPTQGVWIARHLQCISYEAITSVGGDFCDRPIYRNLIRYAPLRRSRLRPFQLKLMMPSAIISSTAAWTAGIASRH